MKIISNLSELRSTLNIFRQNKQKIGFVPTMGALHAGHISLVNRCVAENDRCIVSIFVNPTQFNDKNDFINYPKTMETDCNLLENAGCDIVFAPDEKEMYPETDQRQFDFGMLDKIMEGQHRPGHFNGVGQIVSKLFEAVQPDRAYFGEKDFQQLAIIREMNRQLKFDIEIVGCPIVRETDGLAMSSRNTRMNSTQRNEAVNISKTLFLSQEKAKEMSVTDLKKWVIEAIDQSEELRTEYFEIVDGNTLQAIHDWKDSTFIVGCVAVFCGEIRLIDNITFGNTPFFM